MIFPSTSLATMLVLAFALICWGTWANLQKVLAKNRWRFEFYYVDFAFGVVLAMILAAFTLGSLNGQELSFQDNLLITQWRKIAYVLAAGAIFTLGNMLMVAAIALAGMAVAFTITFGVAGAIGVGVLYATNPRTNAVLVIGGATLFICAVIGAVYAAISEAAALSASDSKALRPDPRLKGAPPPRIGATRPIVLAALGGIFLAIASPLVDWAREGENGIAAYGVAVLFAIGLLLGTFLVLPFFINFPTVGTPVQARTYFKGNKMQHAFGLFAGILWAAGALGIWVSLGAPVSVQAGPAVTYAVSQCGAVLAAFLGLIVWKDLSRGARSKMLGLSSIALFLAAVGVVSSALVK